MWHDCLLQKGLISHFNQEQALNERFRRPFYVRQTDVTLVDVIETKC